MPRRLHDVVIVGAGPAGSALAIELARDGADVLLLEKSHFPRDKVCGDMVSARGLRILDQLGCYDEIERYGSLPIQSSHVYLDGARLAHGAIPKLAGHPPFGLAVPREILDEIIFRKAVETGASTVEGCRVRRFAAEPDGVTVAAEVEGQDRQFSAKMIVGADGASSVVARGAGMEMKDPRYVQLAIRAYCEGLPLNEAILYFEEEFFPGFAWAFPVRDQYSNIGVGMVKESISKGGVRLREFFQRLTAFLRSQARNKGVDIRFSRPAGWPITTYGGAGRNVFERGLLIGDAGCFVDPISGEGIPLALETAQFAAETIRTALTTGDFSVDGLAGYERRWRSHFDPDLGVSDLIVSMIRNRHLAKVWTQSLRVMGLTADQDQDYALKTGGILAGLVPNRQGFSPEVILKSIIHGPAFWMKALNISPQNLPYEMMRLGKDTVKWQSSTARSVIADFDWFQQWAVEIGVKQSRVLATLARDVLMKDSKDPGAVPGENPN